MKNLKPLKKGNSYRHHIGAVHIDTWGKPFLVLTEDCYSDGEHYLYSFYKLGDEYETLELAQLRAEELNVLFDLDPKEYFNSYDSKNILLSISKYFPKSEIKKRNDSNPYVSDAEDSKTCAPIENTLELLESKGTLNYRARVKWFSTQFVESWNFRGKNIIVERNRDGSYLMYSTVNPGKPVEDDYKYLLSL